MTWYRTAKTTTALRKTTLRVDLHVHVGDETDFSNENDLKSAITAVLMSAITKGLDVIGIIAHTGPAIGWVAHHLCAESQYDICVVPGHEYVTTDGVRLIAFNVKEPIPPNLSSIQAIAHVHKNGGIAMACDLSRGQARTFNKAQGTAQAPDMVEIYNAVKGSYQQVDSDFPKFISSAAKNANDLEKCNVFTLIERSELEKIRLIPKDVGEDYIPPYLKNLGGNQPAPPAAPQSTPAPTVNPAPAPKAHPA